jgi:hypothetical protein
MPTLRGSGYRVHIDSPTDWSMAVRIDGTSGRVPA